MRINEEFVGGDYFEAEKSESFVVKQLNNELSKKGISNLKFFHKKNKTDTDIILKFLDNNVWKSLWFIDVHECQFGPPTGGKWSWPLHLPHGVENINNPFRYKNHFENDKNFSMILIDKRKRGRWTEKDIILINKETIKNCNSENIKTHTFGHNREEMMYMIPYNLLDNFWGVENCIEWFLECVKI